MRENIPPKASWTGVAFVVWFSLVGTDVQGHLLLVDSSKVLSSLGMWTLGYERMRGGVGFNLFYLARV